jgi:hypothetical protein
MDRSIHTPYYEDLKFVRGGPSRQDHRNFDWKTCSVGYQAARWLNPAHLIAQDCTHTHTHTNDKDNNNNHDDDNDNIINT